MSEQIAGPECIRSRRSVGELRMQARAMLVDLHRRRVYRAVFTYAIGSWLILQIADVVFPLLEISAGRMKLLACIVAMGFPVTVVIAWIYQVTPNGIEVDPIDADAPHRKHLHELFLFLLTIGTTLGILFLLGMSERGAADHRLDITATDITRPGTSGIPIAAGLERVLRRRLFESAEIRLISTVPDDDPVTHVLWIGVRSSPELVRFRAMLLATDGSGETPYTEEFELPNHDPTTVQQQAAAMIEVGLERALAPRGASRPLRDLDW